VGSLNQFLTSGLITLVNSIFTLVGILFIMLRMNPKLTFVSMSLVPLVALVSIIFRGKVRIAYKRVRIKAATVTAHIAENVVGVKAVKSFSREKENLRRFEKVNTENRKAVMHAAALSSLLHPIMIAINISAAAIIFLYGGRQIQAGTLSVGIVVAFIGYIDRFFQPIVQLSQLYHTMQGAMAGAERIFEILDAEPTVQDKPDAIELPQIRGDVEFRNVTFGYGDAVIIKDVSFSVKAGETIALVGPTGAGKTTITSLLGRQYDIQSGSITIDGIDIRDVTMDSLRKQLAVVLQDSFLFPISVKENIRYGRLDATDQEVESAAKSLGVDEFIRNLTQGYKTQVQEGASKLSTGQKQLVSFVRALLADPRILILDEATSSIDTNTEILIQDALKNLLRGRTSFVIAHRLSTISEADRIMVIDDGQIVESGTHSELLEKGGIYRRLYDAQFRELIDEDEVVGNRSSEL
jgi:ATP-binding cassette subfamily B protein